MKSETWILMANSFICSFGNPNSTRGARQPNS